MQLDGRCNVPRCRSESAIGYLGKQVCEKHWAKYADENQPEDALRRVLSLKTGGHVMSKSKAKVATKARTKKAPAKKSDDTPSRGKLGKAFGLRVVEYWAKLFTDNFKAKLSDDKLAKEMNREYPSDTPYEESDVRTHRGLFNRGKLKYQASAPSQPLHQFDAKGEAQPLWGEKGAARKASSKRTHQPDDVEFGRKPVKVKRVRAAKTARKAR